MIKVSLDMGVHYYLQTTNVGHDMHNIPKILSSYIPIHTTHIPMYMEIIMLLTFIIVIA